MTNQLMQVSAFIRVWKRMTEIYGSQFIAKNGTGVDENGNIINDTWYESLSELNYGQISVGIKKCRDTPNEHPVNLSVFMARCKERQVKPTEYYERLPEPTTERLEENKQAFGEAISKLKSKSGRRCMKYKHESYPEYKLAMAAAMQQGDSKNDFIWERLKANGWEKSDEIAFARNKIGLTGYHAGLVTDEEIHGVQGVAK